MAYEPEDTKHGVSCTCNYLKEYVDFASGKRASDQDIDELFGKTKQLIAFSVTSQSRRGINEIDVRTEKCQFGFNELNVRGTVEAIRFNAQITNKLLDILTNIQRAKTRLDKVLVIEGYISTSHNDVPLIGEACSEIGLCKGDKKPNCLASELAQETLDCLARR